MIKIIIQYKTPISHFETPFFSRTLLQNGVSIVDFAFLFMLTKIKGLSYNIVKINLLKTIEVVSHNMNFYYAILYTQDKRVCFQPVWL